MGCIMSSLPYQETRDPSAYGFYRQALITLRASRVPFLVGGSDACERYTGIVRPTKDLDIFVLQHDCRRVLQILSAAGYHTDLTFPHWLGKVFCGEDFVDVIFSSGNGLCHVDEEWFTHAVERAVMGVSVRLCPPEEMIWEKAFVKERERYDGADIAHILRACGAHLDWPRLLRRFDTHWRVLLSHLVLFGFIYPSERSQIPDWVMQGLLSRLQNELRSAPPPGRLCQGTLLSRAQYLVDIVHWGYLDARLPPGGCLAKEEIDHWTAAIGEKP
jgi:hypothetical protein